VLPLLVKLLSVVSDTNSEVKHPSLAVIVALANVHRPVESDKRSSKEFEPAIRIVGHYPVIVRSD